jgi:RHS repeat-associated protein
VSFVYDALDRRIQKSVDADGAGSGSAVAEKYAYDGDQLYLQFDNSSSLTHRFIDGSAVDEVLVDESPVSGFRWLLDDHENSVRDIVDNDGNVVNHKAYDSFGRVTSETNTAAAADVIFGYTGREFDSETGLQYNRARYYDAATGRFISTDPIGFDGGDGNLYRYAGNSPVAYTDPSGHSAFSKILKQVGGATASLGLSGEFGGGSIGSLELTGGLGLGLGAFGAGLVLAGFGLELWNSDSGHGSSGHSAGGSGASSNQVSTAVDSGSQISASSAAWPDTSSSRMLYVPADIFTADSGVGGSGGGFGSDSMFQAYIPPINFTTQSPPPQPLNRVSRSWDDTVQSRIADRKVSDTAAESALSYLGTAAGNVFVGDYAGEKSNLLGAAGSVALGLTGLDVHKDVLDLVHSVHHWEWTWGHAGKLALNVVAFAPLLGAVKYLKYADEVVDAGKSLVKHADDLSEAGKGIAKNADMAGSILGAEPSVTTFAKAAPDNVVYRALREGEDPTKGLRARSPGANTSVGSHVMNKRESDLISTTKDRTKAEGLFNSGNGVVEIDLNKVNGEVIDASRGVGKGRVYARTKSHQEVLIRDVGRSHPPIPPEAVRVIQGGSK